MSSTQGQNYTETNTYAKQVQFTVSTRSASGFSRDGGRTRIDVPKYKRILNEDRCVLSKEIVNYFNELWGNEYLTVDKDNVVTTRNKVVLGSIGDVAHKRYIKGSNSIWKVEQEKQGTRVTKDDEIFMIWGDFAVDAKNKPTDKGLLIFLLTHNANQDYEFRDSTIAAAAFKVQDNRRDAANFLDIEDKKQMARQIVYELRNESTKGFDREKMDFYTNVFRTQISGYDSDEEKFRALLSLADTKPYVILNGIRKETVDYIHTVQQAIALDILSRDKGKYINTMTQNTVITFKVGTSETEAIAKMVTFYAGKDGAAEYEHLKNSVEAVKISKLQ